MRRHKIRYKTGKVVHSGYAEARETQPVDPVLCRDPLPFSGEKLWLSDYEVMEYSDDHKTQFNDCNHVTITGAPKSVSSYDQCILYHNNSGLACTSYGHNIDASLLEVAIPHTGIAPAPQGRDVNFSIDNEPLVGGPVLEYIYDNVDARLDLDKIASNAFAQFERSVAKFKDFSILNFLRELTDVRRMLRDFKSLASKEQWKKLTRENLKREDLKWIISDSYLSYHFGYVPLLRDLVKILKVLGNLRKRVKYYLSQIHKIKVIYGQIKQYTVPSSTDLSIYTQFQAVECDGMFNYEYPAANIHGQVLEDFHPNVYMKYTLYCEELSRIGLELRMFCESFDVAWDPAIIWNAIPFSFLLDWIWDCSGWLEQHAFQARPLPVKLRILDFAIDWKYEARFFLDTFHTNVSQVAGGAPLDITTTTSRHVLACKRYRRKVFFPDREHLEMANWDKNVIEKTLLGSSLVKTNVLLRNPPSITRRFGPSRRTLLEIHKFVEGNVVARTQSRLARQYFRRLVKEERAKRKPRKNPRKRRI